MSDLERLSAGASQDAETTRLTVLSLCLTGQKLPVSQLLGWNSAFKIPTPAYLMIDPLATT